MQRHCADFTTVFICLGISFDYVYSEIRVHMVAQAGRRESCQLSAMVADSVPCLELGKILKITLPVSIARTSLDVYTYETRRSASLHKSQ